MALTFTKMWQNSTLMAEDTARCRRVRIDCDSSYPSGGYDVNLRQYCPHSIDEVRTAKTPASAGASGNAGDICWDADYLYICVATNTWKRVAIATW